MPEVEIVLPVPFPAQLAAYRVFQSSKRTVIRCGRRWGKTDFAKMIVCVAVAKGENIGWFAPDYKIMAEAYNEIAATLLPIIRSSNKVEGVIRTIEGMREDGKVRGGRVDFWTLENQRAGRSRKYHGIIIDEAAFAKESLASVWEQAIEPTLVDYEGWALILSNTNGIDPNNFFYRICNDEPSPERPHGQFGFKEFHSPSMDNPHLPIRKPDETDEDHRTRRDALFEGLKRQKHPMVYQQEYLAEFVDFSGDAFFAEAWLLEDGQPVPYPHLCDGVVAVIDTAVKTGSDNDGTAVSYYATSQYIGHPVVILDWDIVQIEGALLETWIPHVFRRLEELARECKAGYGSRGAFIEDAQSGSILLQQCVHRGFPAHALPQQLTSAGKDARAINVSGPVFQGKVKWSRYAFEKTAVFKGASRNHMRSQINAFRLGDKDAAKRADDLLDTFTYAVAITLGDSKGIS